MEHRNLADQTAAGGCAVSPSRLSQSSWCAPDLGLGRACSRWRRVDRGRLDSCWCDHAVASQWLGVIDNPAHHPTWSHLERPFSGL